jgi:hypothetical protein
VRPELAALAVADPPASPATLGFALAAGAMEQPGRRIATVRPGAGLGPAVAFMDPEPA